MHRIAPVLLAGGLLLLVSSLGAPASPAIVPGPASAAAYVDQETKAVLDAVSQQIEVLRKQMATRPEAPVASRDPFSFGGLPERRPAPIVELPESIVSVPAPPLELPRLVGIASSGDSGTSSYRAFVSFDGTVREVRPGDAVGPFVVETIGFGAIELRHAERGTVHTIVVR